MAEDAPVDVPAQAAGEEQAEPVAELAPEPETSAEPAAADATEVVDAGTAELAQQDGGVKRAREEDPDAEEQPEAKRTAADADVEGVPQAEQQEPADFAAADGQPEQNGSGNPGYHNNPGPDPVYATEPSAANPHNDGNPTSTGPPPLQEHPELTVHNEDGSVSEFLAVSKHLVGKLIGKGGTTIQQLQATTSTNVQIDQEGRDFPDAKKVTVRGNAEGVAKAKAAIRQMLEEAVAPQEGETEERVPCPAGIVGRVIGRGGETIRSLQQGSGAHILVDQNYPEGADRMVVIRGKPDAVNRAINMVTELIKGEPGSATQIIQKYGLGSALQLSCPKAIVGRIIGKGGETIKGLQRKYHVSIQIDQGGDPMNVTVTGPKNTAQACLQEIQSLINDVPPPYEYGGPGGGYPRPGGYGPPPFGGPAPYGGGGPPGGFGGYPSYGGQAPYSAPYGAPAYGGYPPAGGGGGYGGYGGYQQPAAGGYGSYPGGGYPGAAGGAPSPSAYAAAGGGPAAAGGYAQGAYGGGGGGAAAGGYGGGGDAGGYGGAVSGGAAAAAAPAAAGGLWQAMQDDQGRTYYYNTQTGVSQWEKPDGMP